MNPEPASTEPQTALPPLDMEARADSGGNDEATISSADEVAVHRRNSMLLMTLLKHMPDCVYFKDKDSRFLLTSAYMARRMGIEDPAEMVGKTDFDYFSPAHAQPAFEDEQRIMGSGCPLVNIEEMEVFPNGQVAWVSSSKLPLYNEKGELMGTFGLSRDITARKEMEQALTKTQAELMATSRLAGIAEISSGVLHNIGNALNSVMISTGIVAEHMGKSRIGNLGKAVQMLKDHEADLGAFMTQDPKGKQLPAYLQQLSQVLVGEREAMVQEFEQLRKSVEHIKEIVVMQQNYARISQYEDDVDPVSLIEEALHISEGSLTRHSIRVGKDFDPVPPVRVIRHKVLQILVNLIRNSKYAMDESGVAEKRLTLSLRHTADNRVLFGVMDNGVGITAEVMGKLFSFGFTTRKDGHGFGLHSSMKAAQEMGGTLVAESDGAGKGARFTLSLPACAM